MVKPGLPSRFLLSQVNAFIAIQTLTIGLFVDGLDGEVGFFFLFGPVTALAGYAPVNHCMLLLEFDAVNVCAIGSLL